MSQIDWTKLKQDGSTPGRRILIVALGIYFGALNGVIELGGTLFCCRRPMWAGTYIPSLDLVAIFISATVAARSTGIFRAVQELRNGINWSADPGQAMIPGKVLSA